MSDLCFPDIADASVWSASTHDEIIKRLMAGVGMPNSQSLYGAFKQFANELHALAHATPPPARKWDEGEHEGCGIDSQRAFEKERATMVQSAPGHEDLMVTPESIDGWMKDNPLPAKSDEGDTAETVASEVAYFEKNAQSFAEAHKGISARCSAAIVRPLNWGEIFTDRGDGSKDLTGWEAETDFGSWYSVEQYFGSDSYGYQVKHDFDLVADAADHDDPDQAKAAAQADFEKRVRAGLRSHDLAQPSWKCLAPSKAACAWPDCGCDPEATKVIQALVDQGWQAPPECSLPSTEQHTLPGHKETQDALNSLTIRPISSHHGATHE